MLFNTILANLAQSGNQLLVLLLLSAVDFLFGVFAAIRARKFELEKLAGVLESDLFPILGWLGVVAIAAIPQSLIPAEYVAYTPAAAYGLVFLKIVGSILGSVSSFGVATNALAKIGVQAWNKKEPELKDDVPGAL